MSLEGEKVHFGTDERTLSAEENSGNRGEEHIAALISQLEAAGESPEYIVRVVTALTKTVRDATTTVEENPDLVSEREWLEVQEQETARLTQVQSVSDRYQKGDIFETLTLRLEERDGQRRENHYEIIIDGVRVGSIVLKERPRDIQLNGTLILAREVDNTTIDKPIQGKGVASQAYVWLNRYLQETEGRVLTSDTGSLVEGGQRIWKGLVKRGLAQTIENKQNPEQPHYIMLLS